MSVYNGPAVIVAEDGTEADFLRPDTSDWAMRRWLTILSQDNPSF